MATINTTENETAQGETVSTAPTGNRREKTLKQLGDLLKEHSATAKNLRQDQAFFDKISGEIKDFATKGDVRDVKAVASITVKHTRYTLLPVRIEMLGAEVLALETRLAESNAVCEMIILSLLTKAQCGYAEIAARAMSEHIPDVSTARRQAFQSPKSFAAQSRESDFRYYTKNHTPDEIAKKILDLFPVLADEIATLEKQLGGAIPSLGVMVKI